MFPSIVVNAYPEQGPMHVLVMALSAIIFLLALWVLVRVINDPSNTLEWSHLVSSRAHDGGQYADWNKIGQGLGVILSFWLPSVYAYSPKMEAMGLSAVMGVALLYLGGVSSYAANLRAKQGGVETTKVTEVAPVAKVTETVTQTAPITPAT